MKHDSKPSFLTQTHGDLTKRTKQDVRKYVEHLTTVSCGMSGDIQQLTWHGCGKSGFSVGGATPQVTTYCEGCPNKKEREKMAREQAEGKKGKKKQPTHPPSYTWKTTIHQVDNPSAAWLVHRMRSYSLDPPPSMSIAQDILPWLNHNV